MKEKVYHPVPEWLTRDYLENMLRQYKNDMKLSITDLDLKPATGKGENYASVMTRIRVLFRLSNSEDIHEGSYIAKTTFEGDSYIYNIFQLYQPFKTEMLMYEKILPALTKLLSESGDSVKLFADTIYVDYEHSAIIFEDLARINFACFDRLMGFDMLHTKLAVNKLAKMHAAAAVFNERVPDVLTKFDHGIFNRHTKGFAPFFENMIGVCAEYAGGCDQLGAYYKDKLLKLQAHVVEYATRVYDSQPNHFLTLVHGDYWVNNIMQRYSNGGQIVDNTLKDMLLIDFQFCSWSSPAVDLHYLFNTSLESDVRLQHQDELFQYYHQVLSQTLHKLKFAGHVPTLHEFCVQMEAGRFYAVTSSLVVQPVMINDKNDDADMRALLLDDERGRNFRKTLYTNKNIQRYVKALLPVFDRRGLLDVCE